MRRLVEALNHRNVAAIRAMISPEVAFHTPVRPGQTHRSDAIDSVRAMFLAFPDARHETVAEVRDGDWAAVLYRAEGTNTGPFRGRVATGRRASWYGAIVGRSGGEQIVELVHLPDHIGRMIQLSYLDLPGGCPGEREAAQPGGPASRDEVEGTVRRWFAARSPQTLRELSLPAAPVRCERGRYGTYQGADEAIDLFSERLRSFPDYRLVVDRLLVEGQLAAARWHGSGTDRGGVRGFPPTGRRAAWGGITFLRVVDGKVAWLRAVHDDAALLGQIGLLDEQI